MPLDIGQTVAACVPYTKRRLEWIMAVTQGWNEEEELYPLLIFFNDMTMHLVEKIAFSKYHEPLLNFLDFYLPIL